MFFSLEILVSSSGFTEVLVKKIRCQKSSVSVLSNVHLTHTSFWVFFFVSKIQNLFAKENYQNFTASSDVNTISN